MNPDPTSEVTLPAAADLDATIRVDVRATLPDGIEQPGDMIGRYKLVEPLGQGGFGSVWRAEQHEPIHREVALKVIKPGMDSREIIARFEAERQALALMDHPNIAAVLDAGTTASGRPFFVMELVKGVPITDYCDAKRLGIRQRLELFIPVCQAVQHAHQKSILHRDLKPSNILVMEVDGKAVPKVIDFGIAKALRDTNEAVLHTSLAQTIEGIIVGTPQYMSPEQAGSVADVDTRSDIYTLGVILYELLTGSTPLGREELKQAALDEVFRCIRESEPRRPSSKFTPATELAAKTASLRHSEPRKLGEALKGDLDWIVMRTLEKDRERRYETANALALELGRHLNDEPVLAGPPSVSYRLGKFVRRQKGPLSAAAALFVVSLAGTAVSLWQAGVAKQEAQRARTAEHVADDRAETIRRNLYVAEMNFAAKAAGKPDGLNVVADLTAKWRPGPGEDDLRGWEWHYLRSTLHQDAATLLGHTGEVLAVAYSPDGSTIASAGSDGIIRLWGADARKLRISWKGHSSSIRALSWDSAGKRIATKSYDKTIRVWDPTDGRELSRIEGITGEGRAVSWSLDGTRLAAAAEPYVAKIWDATTGEEIHSIAGVSDPAKSKGIDIFWRPSHSQFALVQGGVRLFDESAREMSGQFGDYSNGFQWNPNGSAFAMYGETQISLWSPDIAKMTRRLSGHQGTDVNCLAWHPSGRFLATAGQDCTLRIWDVVRETELAVLKGHLDGVHSISWRPSGTEIVSASRDSTIKVWSVESILNAPELHAHQRTYSIGWNAHGNLIAAGTTRPGGAAVKVWEYPSGKLCSELLLPHTREAPPDCSWSPSGALIAAVDKANNVRVWDPLTGVEQFGIDSSENLPSNATRIAWDPGGKLLAYGGASRFVTILEAGERRKIAELPVRDLRAIAWHPWNSALALAEGPRLSIWTFPDWKISMSSPTTSNTIFSMAWNPAGTRIVTVDNRGTLTIRRTGEGRLTEETIIQVSRMPVTAVAWHPKDHRIASAGHDKTVRIWNSETGRQLAAFDGHDDKIDSLAWSPDGQRLISGGTRRIIIWDANKSYEMEREQNSK